MILAAATLTAVTGCSSSTGRSAEPAGEPSPTAAAATSSGSSAERDVDRSEQTPAATPTAPTLQPETTAQIGGTLHVMDPALYETVPGTQVEPHDGDEWSQECYGIAAADGLAVGTEVRITDVDGTTVARGEVVAAYGSPKEAVRLSPRCLLEWSARVPTDEDGLLRAEFGDTGTATNEFTLAQATDEAPALDVFLGDQ